MIHSWSMNKLRIHFRLFLTASWSNWQDSFRKFLTVFQFTGFVVSKCRCRSISVSKNCIVNCMACLISFNFVLFFQLWPLRRPNCSKDSSFSVVYKLASVLSVAIHSIFGGKMWKPQASPGVLREILPVAYRRIGNRFKFSEWLYSLRHGINAAIHSQNLASVLSRNWISYFPWKLNTKKGRPQSPAHLQYPLFKQL